MAVPLQYQSQFVPTNFGVSGQVLNMMRQDMKQRNQKFDQAVAMQDMTLANMAEQQTSDPTKQRELIEALRGRIDESVSKRGGDYGAAAQDISGLISKERANPFYGFDKAKLAKMQEYGRLQKQKGLDFYTDRNPNDITLEDYLADPTSLEFQSYDLSQLDKMAALKAKEKATEMMRSVNNPVEGMMREIGNVYGFDTQEEGAQFIADNPQFLGDIAESYGITDPTVIDRMKQAALTEMVGKRDTRFVADQEAILSAKAQLEENPYKGIPMRGVGTSGIENVYPIKGKKDFWKISSDINTTEGLTRKSIINDIVSDDVFIKSNGEYLKEFGTVDNAKKLTDNYTGGEDITKSNVVQDYLEQHPEYLENAIGPQAKYTKLALLYTKLEEEGKIDRGIQTRKRDKYNKASKFIDNFNKALNDRLFQENSDLGKKFKHYNTFTGFDKLDAATEKRMKNFQDFVSEDLDLDDLVFEGSNNKDINFADLDVKDILDDKNYISAKGEGNTKVIGYAVDPLLGIKLKIKTKGEKGNWVTHIASPANSDIEQLIMSAYTNGENVPEMQSYKVFKNNQYGQALMQGMDTPQIQDTKPELIPIKGSTVKEYKQALADKVNSGIVSQEDAEAIITYLHTNFRDDITL